MKICISSVCNIGLERTNNEDAFAVCPNLETQDWSDIDTNIFHPLASLGALSIVADGMGGANAGEVASSLAIESFKNHFSRKDGTDVVTTDSECCDFLREGFIKSNEAILAHVLSYPDSIGLGTTIVLVWLKKEKAYIAWCGDSRCYCFNPNNGLRLLTKDHSLVQELVDKGEIKACQAFCHPDSNIITRCLGDVDAITEPEVSTYDVKDGDVFLLCSDGLCGYCQDNLIEKVMYRHYDNLKECTDALLQIALDAGGQDNITISLCATLPSNWCSSKVGLKGKIKRLMARF